MTSLSHGRSPFIVPTLLFYFHSNGLALAYFSKQHRYGYSEYNFSTDSNNEGTTSYAYEERWEIRFNELKDYKREHGDTLVPCSYAKNPQLGIWVSTQRDQYKRGKISDERIRRLNELGFVWEANEAAWKVRFNELKEYKREHGDTLVPQRYAINPQLGWWVKSQRDQYKRNQLSDERIRRLNEISFVWDPNEEFWEEMFMELKKYKEKYGDTLVPYIYARNPQLGIWVGTQRVQYKRNQISDERINRLNEIGFVWDPNEAAWEEMFVELKKYKQKYGDTLVPQDYEDNPQLGSWVNKQRTQYKHKKLSVERIRRLNDVGFVWDALEVAWQSKYNKICSFHDEHGHTKIPCQDEEHMQLYHWCMRQRELKAKGKLNDDRRDLLQKINFDFFMRKVTKGSSLLENMIIYELEEIGHVFDMANAVFFEKRYRPDGVIFVDDSTIIFIEVDEKFHNCSSHYPIKKELDRMIALKTEAERNGYKHVTFVRIGTGDQRRPNFNQLTFVSDHLHELKRTAPWKTSRVHYIDYPTNHHHVLASKSEEAFNDEVIEFSSGIWC